MRFSSRNCVTNSRNSGKHVFDFFIAISCFHDGRQFSAGKKRRTPCNAERSRDHLSVFEIVDVLLGDVIVVLHQLSPTSLRRQ